MERLMKNRRGQFYLIAAVMLVAVMIGLIALTNSFSGQNYSKIEKYGNELKIESEKVLDYDLKNNANEIYNFTKTYSEYIGKEIDSYYIYGENLSVEVFGYESGVRLYYNGNLSVTGSEINFLLGSTHYKFELTKGKNFYFILYQEIDGEVYVYTN